MAKDRKQSWKDAPMIAEMEKNPMPIRMAFCPFCGQRLFLLTVYPEKVAELREIARRERAAGWLIAPQVDGETLVPVGLRLEQVFPESKKLGRYSPKEFGKVLLAKCSCRRV